MKWLFCTFLALCTLGGASVFASPTTAFVYANRVCTVVASDNSTYELKGPLTANDSQSWYGTGRFYLDSIKTLSVSLTGYLTAWYTYEHDLTSLREEGPSAATRLLSSDTKLDLTSVDTWPASYPTTNGESLVYAVFTPITYKVEYELGGGEFREGAKVVTEATYDQSFTVPAPVCDFYSFAGWRVGSTLYFEGENESVTLSNLTAKDGDTVKIGAVWSGKPYPLQLVVGEGIAKIHYRTNSTSAWLETATSKTINVTYGEAWSAWAEAAYGYEGTGSGWEAESVTGGTMTEKGDKFKPEAKKRSFNVKASAYPTDGGSVAGSGTYEYLTQVELAVTTARGHTFTGWSDGATDNPHNITVISATNITAKFVRNSYSLKLTVPDGISNVWYRVGGTGDFISISETRKISVLYGAKYECYATPDYGWSISGIGSSEENLWEGTMSDGDLTFVPSPERNVYRVQLLPDSRENGSVGGAGYYAYEETVELWATPESGHRFMGWSDGSTENPYWYTVTSNVSLTANFESREYGLELVVNEGIAKICYKIQNEDESWPEEWTEVTGSTTVDVGYGTSYRVYAESESGYSLTGSGSSEGSYVSGTIKTDGFLFSPVATVRQYLVTVSASPSRCGTVDKSGTGYFNYGKIAIVYANAESGYLFDHWEDMTNGKTTVSEEPTFQFPVTNDAALVAVFVPETFTVTFKYRLENGAWHEEEQKVAYGASAIEPADEVRNNCPGYTFVQWDSSAWKSVQGDCEIIAVYDVGNYTVKFEANGGEGAMRDQTFTFGEEQALHASTFTRTGYLFVGWSKTVTAESFPVDYADQERVKDLTSSTSLILYAVWRPISYTIVFEPGVGTGDSFERTVKYDEPFELPECPFEYSTGFSGWYDSSTQLTYLPGETVSRLVATDGGTVTLKAIYGKGSQITFHATYKDEYRTQYFSKGVENSIRANDFVRKGYSFVGWTTNPLKTDLVYTDQQLATDPAANGENLDLYALWKPNTYQVVFDGNGATSGSMEPIVMTNDVARIIGSEYSVANPDNSFKGWGTNSTECILIADKKNDNKVTCSNLTFVANDHIRLYAIWEDTSKTPDESSVPSGWTGTNLSNKGWTDLGNGLYSNTNNANTSATLSTNKITRGTLTFEWTPSAIGDVKIEKSVSHQTITNTIEEATRLSCTTLTVECAGKVLTNLTGKTTREWEKVTLVITNESGTLSFKSGTIIVPDINNVDIALYPCMLRNIQWTPYVPPVYLAEFVVDPAKGAIVGGGEEKQMVDPGKTALEPTVIGTNGYDFAGWYDKNGQTNIAMHCVAYLPMTATNTFTALFTPHEYSIIYANRRTHNNPHNDNVFISTNGLLKLGGGNTDTSYVYGALEPFDTEKDFAFKCWTPSNLLAGVYGTYDATNGVFNYTNVVTQAIWDDMIVQTSAIFTVTFVSGEGDAQTNVVEGVECGKGVTTAPVAASRLGYYFTGWDRSLDDVKENFTTKAKYALSKYRLEYVNLKGTTNENGAEYDITSFQDQTGAWTDAKIDDPINSNSNIEFLYWTYKDKTGQTCFIQDYLPLAMTNDLSDLTLTANWAYRVTFARTAGDHVDVIEGEQNLKVKMYVPEGVGVTNAPAVTCAAGYAFKGWKVTEPADKESLNVLAANDGYFKNAAGECFFAGGVVTNVTQAMTLQAVATACVYRVTYEDLEGAENSTQNRTEFTVEDTITFVAPGERKGYCFKGWDPSEIKKGTTNDITVKATWDQAHTVNFKAGHNLTLKGNVETNIVDGETVTTPEVICNKGYAFAGWQNESGEFVDAVPPVTNKATYTAVATACVYTITYQGVPDGMDNPNPTCYTVESNEIVFAALSKQESGEPFAGWTPTGIAAGSTGDVTVVASWGPLYRVEVQLEGQGEVKVEVKVEVEGREEDGQIIKLPNLQTSKLNNHYSTNTCLTLTATPSNGWLFAGWATSEQPNTQTSEQPNVQTSNPLTFTVTNAVSLTAVFTQIVHAVTIDGKTTGVAWGTTYTAFNEASVTNGATNIVCTGWTATGSAPVSGTSNTVAFVVTEPTTLAWLTQTNYLVQVEVEGEGEVKVEVDGREEDGPTTEIPNVQTSKLKNFYSSGTSLTLTATPADGWFFAGWTTPEQPNAQTSELPNTQTNLTLTSAVSLTAVFEKIPDPEPEPIVTNIVAEVASEYVPKMLITPIAVSCANCAEATLKVTGLPTGLKFTSNQITGVPTKSGRTTAVVTATLDGETIAETNLTFVIRTAQEASVNASVNGTPLMVDGCVCEGLATNLSVGVYLEWPVAVEASSSVKVSVSGLPSGLKFTAKPVTKKVTTGSGKTKVTTVVTNVPANTIYGVPTAASKTDRSGAVKPSQVKIVVTTADKSKLTGVLEIVVKALDAALVGTYAGGATNEPIGSASVTLAKTGKISGKWVSEGKTWTLSAAGLDALDEDGVAHATVTFKSGSVSETYPISLAAAAPVYAVAVTDFFTATYVPWKTDAELKLLAVAFKNETFTAAPEAGVTLSGKVGAAGAVTVKGAFDLGAKSPYTVSATGTLVPLDGSTYELFVYYPPRAAKNFAGYAVNLILRWDGTKFDIIAE